MKKGIITAVISGALGVALGLFLKKKKVIEKEKLIIKEVPAQLNIKKTKTEHKFPYESLSFSLLTPFFSIPGSRPVIHNGEAYLPLDFFEETLNISTYYIKERQEILIETIDKRIAMKLDKRIAYVDDSVISILHEPIMRFNEVYVPITEVFQNLGCRIYKDEKFGEITVYF